MIDIVYPRATEQGQLAAMVAVGAEFEDPTVTLFISDTVPGINSVIGDFTLADNTVFPGYAASSAVTWTATPVNLPNGHSALKGSEKLFICNATPPAPLAVYGYILNGAGTGKQFVRFETPRTIEAIGDYVIVDPYMVTGNQSVDPLDGD